jgi:hypothetical protein
VGLFDFVTDVFSNDSDSLFGDALQLLGGSGGSSYSVSPVSFQPYSMQPYPNSGGPVYQTAGAAPMIAGATMAVANWMRTYPALALAIQRFRSQRIPMTIEKLWSQLKRFGPATLTGIVGADAVRELIMYKATHKRRRMNPANTRALGRSLRRLKSFDHLSQRVSSQLSRSCHTRRRKTTK